LDLVGNGRAQEAERYWRRHMEAAGQLLLREYGATTVVDLLA
jgi:hypothetical protein